MNTERQFALEKEKFGLEKEKFNKELGVKEQVAARAQEKENQKLSVGNLGLAKTEKEAVELRQTISKSKSFVNTLDKLIALRDKYDSETFHGKVYGEMKSLHSQLVGYYKDIQKLGTLDRGVLTLFDRVLPDPTEYGFRIDTYKKFREGIERDVENDIRSKLQEDSSSRSTTNPEEYFYNGKTYIMKPDGSLGLKK